jgi:hypothetical protein
MSDANHVAVGFTVRIATACHQLRGVDIEHVAAVFD